MWFFLGGGKREYCFLFFLFVNFLEVFVFVHYLVVLALVLPNNADLPNVTLRSGA